MMLSITAWIRRDAPAGPGAPSGAWTVGGMPLKPLGAAARRPSAVVARALAGGAAWAAACAAAEGEAAAAGRSELNGTTTTVRLVTLSDLPWPDMSGSLTTGIMLSDPAGMNRDLTGSNRSWFTCTP